MIYTFFPAFADNSHFAFLINALPYFWSTYKLYLVLCAVFVVRECHFGDINIGDINVFSTSNIVFDADKSFSYLKGNLECYLMGIGLWRH